MTAFFHGFFELNVQSSSSIKLWLALPRILSEHIIINPNGIG